MLSMNYKFLKLRNISYLIETNADALDRFDEMSLPERFAMSLGASRGTVLHHLDPVLNIFVPTFQWRKDLPDARIPEMFALMCHPKVLARKIHKI